MSNNNVGPVVYVVQDDGYKNFSQAESFGDLKVVFTRDIPIYSDPAPRVHHAVKTMAKYIPEKDHILLVGDPVSIGVVCGAVLKMFGQCSLLKWDKSTRSYNSIRITLNA